MMVSQVGRTTSGSSSLASGSGQLPSIGLEPVMGDDRHFLGEAFDVLGFLRDS